jgi:hypothetical protein
MSFIVLYFAYNIFSLYYNNIIVFLSLIINLHLFYINNFNNKIIFKKNNII